MSKIEVLEDFEEAFCKYIKLRVTNKKYVDKYIYIINHLSVGSVCIVNPTVFTPILNERVK